MRKRYIPFAKAKSIYEIDVSFFHKHGIKYVITDLDNTLEPYDEPNPGPRCKELAKKLKDAGIILIIGSNNISKRVTRFANEMGIESLSLLRKPFSGPLRRFLKEKGYRPEETMLIGDQIMTDIIAGNGAGIKTVLTEPFKLKEPPWTRFNRLFDKPKRKKIMKYGLCPDWRDA